ALTRIVLNDRYGVVFESCAHPPDMDAMLGRADAALVIGDPALENADRTTPHLDLGAEWTALTGLPFVYAFWAGRPDAVAPADVAALRRSAEAGIPRIPEIAAEYARTRNHPTAFYTAYLSDHLSYALGPEEQAGLMEFYRRALRLGLIDHIPTISNFEE
ncbi:MAG: hypothetical protein FJY97_12975, partial [candidate division Zixibacteria bacterium]|nr:hypothetical protein [candidate division Zixibacteria bacterium]